MYRSLKWVQGHQCFLSLNVLLMEGLSQLMLGGKQRYWSKRSFIRSSPTSVEIPDAVTHFKVFFWTSWYWQLMHDMCQSAALHRSYNTAHITFILNLLYSVHGKQNKPLPSTLADYNKQIYVIKPTGLWIFWIHLTTSLNTSNKTEKINSHQKCQT